jgi:hypothetical protein
MKKSEKSIPQLTEFTDDDGKKWIQTSTEDLFSIKELNEILETIDRDKEVGEIVLARIDFQKVNKEYYQSVQELQGRLKKRNEQLRKLLVETKTVIDRKNKKLRELIDYIKKLHLLLAYYKLRPEDFEKLKFTPEIYTAAGRPEEAVLEEMETPKIDYSSVEEVALDDTGEESSPL